MKILLLINSLSAGGAEVFITGLACQLKKSGHTVEMYTYAGVLDSKGEQLDQSLAMANIKHHRGSGSLFRKIIALKNVIQSFRPDIIHSNLEQSDTLLLTTSLTIKKCAWIRTLHSEYATKKIPRFVHKLLSLRFDAAVCCSTSVSDKYPFIGKNSTTIENGISKPTSLETQKPNNKNDTLFINIGSFHIRDGVLPKAQDVIISAIKLIDNLDFTVLFVGDGIERDRLKAVSKSLGIEHKCIFIGIHDSPATLLQNADAFLLPSRFEGMPISCLEAIGCAKPLILSDIPSLKRFKTECTLYCAPADSKSLAQKMQEFIENKATLKEKAKTVMPLEFAKYSIEECAKKYLNQYINILRPSGERLQK